MYLCIHISLLLCIYLYLYFCLSVSVYRLRQAENPGNLKTLLSGRFIPSPGSGCPRHPRNRPKNRSTGNYSRKVTFFHSLIKTISPVNPVRPGICSCSPFASSDSTGTAVKQGLTFWGSDRGNDDRKTGKG